MQIKDFYISGASCAWTCCSWGGEPGLDESSTRQGGREWGDPASQGKDSELRFIWAKSSLPVDLSRSIVGLSEQGRGQEEACHRSKY